jgi:hypothetical protein
MIDNNYQLTLIKSACLASGRSTELSVALSHPEKFKVIAPSGYVSVPSFFERLSEK